MGTRRAVERSPAPSRHPSTNGTEGPAEEEPVGPGVRPDSRNYLLNVRPENRTTFCAIISQLTEETQPSFEATLKSRAVSEDGDAKFMCIVSGFPEPELTWYKDDEEMDRYCGLPKYEILRNGKRHTLQLYKCREEDAAIYQASARNSKGIVSCSGVLEVGTMTEYKIHQRWFAKLKRKAEAKMREIEQSRKRGKENMLDKLRTLSPERIQRKRRFSAEGGKKSPAPVKNGDDLKLHIPDSTSRLNADVAILVEQQLLNGESDFPNEIMPRLTREEIIINGYASPENMKEDGKEIITKRPTAKESSAKKKKKEEESSGTLLEVKREDKGCTSAMQKSPVSVRSRFAAADSKNQVPEKMEVEKSAPTQASRKGLTVSPKISKMTFARDTKTIKDSGTIKCKQPEVCTTPLCLEPSKEEGYFSLREMYLENTVLPAEEKKPPPIPERVRSKTKAEMQAVNTPKQKPPETSRTLPAKPTQERATAILRQEKEAPARRDAPADQSAGSKLMQIGSKSLLADSKKRQSQITELPPKIHHSVTVEKGKVSEKTGTLSTPALKTLETNSGEADQLEAVLGDVESGRETLAVPICSKVRPQDSPPCGKDNLNHSTADTHGEQLVSETPNEVMAREEAFQKYHHLEMEYQALQQAYALLQQQLEQTLKSDGEVEELKKNVASVVAETSSLVKKICDEDTKFPVTKQIQLQSRPSDSLVSDPEMPDSKYPAAVGKHHVSDSVEPKPPARKLKGHGSESTVLTPAVKASTMELETVEPLQKSSVLEQCEPKPPVRKTKASASEPNIIASVPKDASADLSEANVPVLSLKSPNAKLPAISPAATPNTPLPQLKDPLLNSKNIELKYEPEASASECISSDSEPQLAARDTKEEMKISKKHVNTAEGPVSMDTELSDTEQLGNVPMPVVCPPMTVNDRSGEQLPESEMLSDVCCDTPLVIMEYTSENKENNTVDTEIRDKDVQAQLLLTADTMAEGIIQKSDVQRSQLKEWNCGQGTERLPGTAVFPAEVEMIEDTKQNHQTNGTLTAVQTSCIVEHRPCLEIDPSLPTTHEIMVKKFAMVEEVSKKESDIIHPPLTDAVAPLYTQSPHQESHTKMSIFSSPSEESVATLMRDVKKELETKPTNVKASLTETDHGAILLRKNKLHLEEDIEVQISLQVSPGEMNEQKQVVTANMSPKKEENILKTGILSPDHLTPKDTLHLTVTMPLVSQKTPETVLANLPINQEKQNSGFVASLKNSLLMLLNITKAEADKNNRDTKVEIKVNKVENEDNCTNRSTSPDLGVGDVCPTTIAETGKNDVYIQKDECLTSSSTSGIMTPMSDDEMAQNVEVLQQSPTTYRKFAEAIDKELFPNIEVHCSTPNTATINGTNKKPLLIKDDFHSCLVLSRSETLTEVSETEGTALTVPSIVVAKVPLIESEEVNDGLSDLSPDENDKAKSEESIPIIPAATPQELALGARRKIYISKPKQLDEAESNVVDSTTKRDSPNVSPGLPRRNHSLLHTSTASQSPPMERRSPGLVRKMTTLEVPKINEEPIEGNTSENTLPGEKDSYTETKEDLVEPTKANDPYKAPQVIRKIRAEQFSDASGNLKLWCQFFNILSDSTISWFKDEYPVAEAARSSGDEGQVSLAIVQAAKNDCGVYQCTIQNKYGTDSTDFLLSAELLSGFVPREETEVGEEIEMTPMVFAKGLADSGYWGDKFFGRIVAEDVNVGKGYRRKVLRVKVIYGLEPIFESGKTCIIKIRNLITFGTKNESTLVEKNYDLTIQGCKIQNTTREYCKIFAAEARVVPNFGHIPEIIPLNLIYRPANNIPYATIEDDLKGQFEKYCTKDKCGNLNMKNTSEIEKKCCAFQHWVYQWTNGNFLVTDLHGVDWKITNVAIATKSKGYQGLKESSCPATLDLFTSVHQCNNYCEMLGLRSLKTIDTLQTPAKPKGSKSPSMERKSGSARSSPQIPKKGIPSPQGTRKNAISPKMSRKSTETGEPQSSAKHKIVETPKPVRM